MAVPSRLAFLTILLCFFLAGAAVANSQYGDEIHAVKQCSPDSKKGDQCTEENDGNDDVDDDFDDTYKIIDNVAVSLSPSGRLLQQKVTANETATAPATATANETTATATEKETTKEAETETKKEDVDLEDNPSSEEEVGNLFVLGH